MDQNSVTARMVIFFKSVLLVKYWLHMSLFHGSAFVEFRDSFDGGDPVHSLDAVRIVNEQAELINESLGMQFRTDLQRRQSVVYLLEQCILLCSELIPSTSSSSRRRFRRIRRAVERARRMAHRDA